MPQGFNVLFYEGMRGVQGPGGFNVLFYEDMRGVQVPGGFDVLFYVRTVSRCLRLQRPILGGHERCPGA